MIRKPSTNNEIYAWHSDSLNGLRPRVYADQPQCGWFRIRLVRGGPWVPVRIWLDQQVDEFGQLTAPEVLRCEVAGKLRSPGTIWPSCANGAISEDEWRALVDGKDRPEMRATRVKVDLSRRPTRPTD